MERLLPSAHTGGRPPRDCGAGGGSCPLLPQTRWLYLEGLVGWLPPVSDRLLLPRVGVGSSADGLCRFYFRGESVSALAGPETSQPKSRAPLRQGIAMCPAPLLDFDALETLQ